MERDQVSGGARALVVGFQFYHHGQHTAFRPLARALVDQRVIDVTPPYPAWMPRRIRDRLWSRWLYYSEYAVYPSIRWGGERVIHYFFSENMLYRCPDWCGKKRLVATVHQPLENLRAMSANPSASRYLAALRKVDAAVVLGTNELGLQELLAPGARVEVIPLGVDTAHFAPPPGGRRREDGRPLSVLTIGNWLRDYSCWAETVRRMQGMGVRVEWTVVANADTHQVARKALGPGDAGVRWLERIGDDELLRLYAEADVLFIPLTGAVANCAILEGMSVGLPIVATDLPAVREYVGDEHGIYVPRGGARACVRALAHIADASAERELRGRGLRMRAETRYAWSVIAERYRKLYVDLAMGSPLPRGVEEAHREKDRE